MDSKIIDGNALAKKHEKRLKQRLDSIKKDRNPSVVSFCNQDDPPSVKYTFMKLAKASDLGIDFIVEEFSADTPKEKLTELVEKYAENPEVDGMLVQLPLPEELNPFKGEILNLIPLEKDVDGLMEGSPYLPAAVKAVVSILDEYVQTWETKKIALVGSEGEIGKPLFLALEFRGSNVSNPGGWNVKKVDKNIGRIEKDLKDADIIISVTGEENLIKPQMISDGVVLIDVGLGDFDPECFQKALKYTPKIGGVGPMTVISLMENVVESYEKRMVK